MNRIENIIELSSHADKNLPELADLIWGIKQNHPDAFAKLPELTGLGRRRAAALAAIGRVFGGGRLDPDVMIEIGWSKLDAVAPYVTAKTMTLLVHQARHLKLTDLRRFLRGEPTIPDARVMLLKFDADDYAVVADTLLRYGAEGDAEGMAGKEAAMVAAFLHLQMLIA